MKLHALPATKRRRVRRLGRGHGSGRGTYSGRGIKGQKARTGGRKGNDRRAIAKMLSSTPKVRGFSSSTPSFAIIDLGTLERRCGSGDTVSLQQLRTWANGSKKARGVKLLGKGPLSKALTLHVNAASAAATAAVNKAGGRVVLLPYAK